MSRRTIEQTVAEMVQPITESRGYELVDVEFVKEGASWYLKVYIDKTGGITLDDCQLVSEELSDRLDRLDPIQQRYFLEVSSPGLERPLKKESDFKRYMGSLVEVKLFEPIDGQKVFEGELAGLFGSKVVIKDEKGAGIEFDREKIALVKRKVVF